MTLDNLIAALDSLRCEEQSTEFGFGQKRIGHMLIFRAMADARETREAFNRSELGGWYLNMSDLNRDNAKAIVCFGQRHHFSPSVCVLHNAQNQFRIEVSHQ
jgi:hypothetical protein